MDKKQFVTIHRISKNVDLMKDVGMIPYIMSKYYGYSSRIVCNKNDDDYPYHREYIPQVDLVFLNKKIAYLHQILYVIKHAGNIDVLNMYHLSIHNSLLTFCIYKICNPNGKTYLKLDLDFEGMSAIENYSNVKKQVIKFTLKWVDCVSAESNVICKRFAKCFARSAAYIPNGYHRFAEAAPDCVKENIFLSVGRLGTEQKSNEDLVSAFVKISDLCDWQLVMAGSITDTFKDYLNSTENVPENVRSRIIYKGEIEDKAKLYAEYQRAKVFILSSKWEGFPLVIPEAISYGCYLILSDRIPPAQNLCEADRLGDMYTYHNVEELADLMLQQTKRKINHANIVETAREKYSWKSICRIIEEDMK